jgi:thiaminase/transcriptional activator TenA
MSGFFETLKKENEPLWNETTTHRFVGELCAGSVADSVMGRYLTQDHRFINHFLGLLGAAVNYADQFDSRIVLGRFIGMISSDENDYFLRSFKALGISEEVRSTQPDSVPTAGLKNIMLEAARSDSYAATISVLSVAESVYLEWALRATKPYPANFIYTEWITLHNNDYFIGFVNFLQRELDRIGPANADICRDFFSRTVQLEKAFFDDAYA